MRARALGKRKSTLLADTFKPSIFLCVKVEKNERSDMWHIVKKKKLKMEGWRTTLLVLEWLAWIGLDGRLSHLRRKKWVTKINPLDWEGGGRWLSPCTSTRPFLPPWAEEATRHQGGIMAPEPRGTGFSPSSAIYQLCDWVSLNLPEQRSSYVKWRFILGTVFMKFKPHAL